MQSIRIACLERKRSQAGPKTYLGLKALLAISFYFFDLLHVQHLCLWSWQTPENDKYGAKNVNK